MASVTVMYHVFVTLGNISFNAGPLYISCLSAWLDLPEFGHSFTIPLGFGARTRLLHYSAITSTLSGTSM